MRNPLSKVITEIEPSGIRKFFDIVNEMQDAISLGVGEPDFDTPWHIRDEGIYSLEKGRTFYTSNAGLKELKMEIARYIERKCNVAYDCEHEVLVTVGGSEAIDIAMRAMLDPGDEVLIPQPSFVCYTPCAMLANGTPVIIELKAENEFRLTAEEVRAAITPKTKLLVLPFPNNPTGSIMTKSDLEEIANVVIENDLYVLSDEIYSELTYGGAPHVTIASLPGMRERTIVINGFSKAFAMTGWRMGYTLAHADLIKQCMKVQSQVTSNPCSIAQAASAAALEGDFGEMAAMREAFMRRRDMAYAEISSWEGVICPCPEGAFYLFPDVSALFNAKMPDDAAFCRYLLDEARVAVMPGAAFGDPRCVRFSYSVADEVLKSALHRVKKALYA